MTSAEVLRKLEFLFIDFLEQLARNPKKIVLKTSYDEIDIQLHYPRSRTRKLAADIYCLQQIYKLVLFRKISTKRELYYENTNLYKVQATCDRSITVACEVLNTQRRDLNVMSCSKGILQGSLCFLKNNVGLIDANLQNILITEELLNHRVISNAKCILVVEKEATFQKLIDELIFESFPRLILITGKGYPDICSRLFIRWLQEKLNIPVYGLFDCDPHGVEIYLTYKYGSSKDRFEGREAIVREMEWIGVYPSDIHIYPIEDNQYIPLKNSDYRKIEQLEKRSRSFGEDQIVAQLGILREERHKLELEAISSIGNGFIVKVFLKAKLKLLFEDLASSDDSY